MFVLEPLFALLTCLLVYWGIGVYRRHTSEFVPDPDFERWCASGPLLMAFRCRGDAHDLRMLLRQTIAPDEEILNLRGGAPWQYYHYEVVVRSPSESVVTVHLCAAKVQRGEGKACVDAAEVVARLVSDPDLAIEEVWLHGQLHPSDAPSRHRDRVHWIGQGPETLAPMIGQPVWSSSEAA